MFKQRKPCSNLEIHALFEQTPEDRPLLVYMTFCDVMLLPWNRHFVTTLVDVNFSPIFAEWRHCLWRTNSMNAVVFQVFSVHFLWHFSMKLYQNVRIAITRLFHCINICRSHGRCLNTPPSASRSNNSLGTRQWPHVQTTPLGPGNGLVFKQLPWDPATASCSNNFIGTRQVLILEKTWSLLSCRLLDG